MEDSTILLSSPWAKHYYALVEMAREELFIAAPYIAGTPVRNTSAILSDKQSDSPIRVNILTNLAIDSMLAGSLDVASLLHLTNTVADVTITYLPGLHAKIYIADTQAAVVTSANLTNNGLSGNHEYGVLLRDPFLVRQTRDDLRAYSALGSRVSDDTLAALALATEELRTIKRRADSSINAQLRKAFQERTESAHLELLMARAEGKTTHGLLCDTITYLLKRHGPLATVDLHPLIRQIHPDLCDDAVDRVIGGVHFGKKWKHYVRNAQQALKRQGVIDFDGYRWSHRAM